jgi:hypothetical protein
MKKQLLLLVTLTFAATVIAQTKSGFEDITLSNNSVKKIILQNVEILKFLKIHKKPSAIANYIVRKLINRFMQFLEAR